jgi:hypothetical protein
MKKITFLLLLMASSIGFSQSINDYKYAIVPSKFSFLKEQNQYRMNLLTKMFMEKYGFVTYFDTDVLPTEVANQNCNKVYVDVLSNGGLFTTKLTVVLKDCKNEILFTSVEGKSRDKEYQIAYNQALREAFNSFDKLGYKYSVNNVNNNNNVNNAGSIALFAQPIESGFQLVDNTPKVVMKIFKTSNKDCYIATKGNSQGVFITKDNQWFFEYYQNDKLISERVEVKF